MRYYAKTADEIEATIRVLDHERAVLVRQLQDRRAEMAAEWERAERALERLLEQGKR